MVDGTRLNVLVEGFDPEKIKNNREVEEDWETVYSARQNNTVIQGKVRGIEEKTFGNKKVSCAIIFIGKIKGLIPLDFSGVEKVEELRELTGTKIAFKIINLDKEAGLFTGNRKAALEHMANVTWNRLEENQTIIGVVKKVKYDSFSVDIGGIQVKIPIEEYDFGWVDDLRDKLKVDDHLGLKVLKLDRELKKVKLSHKATKENPWNNISAHFEKGNEYLGTVSGVANYGVFVNLGPGVDALAPHLKFDRVQKGSEVLIRLHDINKKEEKIRGKILRVI